MKRTLMLVAALTLSAAAVARPVEAQVAECIQSCNDDFPGTDLINIAIRGYCYAFRCYVS